MIWIYDFGLLVLVIITALLTLNLRDLMGSAIVFGTYSFLMCLLWTVMGAVDVAFTEAAVGAGVSTVFVIATAYNIKKEAKD